MLAGAFRLRTGGVSELTPRPPLFAPKERGRLRVSVSGGEMDKQTEAANDLVCPGFLLSQEGGSGVVEWGVPVRKTPTEKHPSGSCRTVECNVTDSEPHFA